MTKKTQPKRVSISHLAMEVIENSITRYFDLLKDNFVNEENDKPLEYKVRMELYEFLLLNDFYVDEVKIKDNKATLKIHSLFTDVMKAEFILEVELIDKVLIIIEGELLALRRLRKRD